MQHAQELLAVGFILVLAVLAILNFKAFVTGSIILARSPKKHATIDNSRMKAYIFWVAGLTALCSLYNLIITRNLTYLGEATGTEFFFLAVGLISVILYKKTDRANKEWQDRDHKILGVDGV